MARFEWLPQPANIGSFHLRDLGFALVQDIGRGIGDWLPDSHALEVLIKEAVPAPGPSLQASGLITGTWGNDLLRGDQLHNQIAGLRGDDRLEGLAGNDALYGGAGRDQLLGGEGRDVLNGGPGRDIVLGGAGADTFVLASPDSFDLVRDFDSSDGDRIKITIPDLLRDPAGGVDAALVRVVDAGTSLLVQGDLDDGVGGNFVTLASLAGAAGLTEQEVIRDLVPVSLGGEDARIALTSIGTYHSHPSGPVSGVESPAYDPESERLFLTRSGEVEIVDIGNPGNPDRKGMISTIELGGIAQAVAFAHGVLAVAVQSAGVGIVRLFDAEGTPIAAPIPVGDNANDIAFTPDDERLVVTSTGEPTDDLFHDPKGSVSIIELGDRTEIDIFGEEIVWYRDTHVETLDFDEFNGARDQLLKEGVRIYDHAENVARDLEPLSLTISADSDTAWITLQDNNAIAILDIDDERWVDIMALGTSDHSRPGHGFDASDEDGAIRIRPWPIHSYYQPDEIEAFRVGGQTYLVTANEGDPRDTEGYSEAARVRDLTLDPAAFPNAQSLQEDENLGRLRVTTAEGDTDGDGDFDALYMLGSRSFSIWTAQGDLVFDSGEMFERVTADAVPRLFNTSSDENDFDSRSDDRGPEPEEVAVGTIDGRTYAFIAFERIGGTMVFDVSDPARPVFQQYINNRNFAVDPQVDHAGALDLEPEGVFFISREDSPIDAPLAILTHEESNTTTIFRIDQLPQADLIA